MNTNKVKLFVSTGGLVADVFRYGVEALGLGKEALFFIDTRLIGSELDLAFMPVDVRIDEVGYGILEERWADLQEVLLQAQSEGCVQHKHAFCEENDDEWGDAGLLRQFLRSRGLPFEWIVCDAFSIPGQIDYTELRISWRIDSLYAVKQIDLRIDSTFSTLFQPGDRFENIPGEGAQIIGSDGSVRRTMSTRQGEALLRAIVTSRR